MGDQVISFRSSDVDRPKLTEILARHLAYEQAQMLRALVIRRAALVVTAAALIASGTHAISWRGVVLIAAVLALGAVIALGTEWRARMRLIAALEGVPLSTDPLAAADVHELPGS